MQATLGKRRSRPGAACRPRHQCPRALLLVLGVVVGINGQAQDSLHLMFPYDYLSMPPEQRRLYTLGVIDARLSALVGNSRLAGISRCLTRIGVGGVQRVVETEIVPTLGAGGTPMPYVVDSAIARACAQFE